MPPLPRFLARPVTPLQGCHRPLGLCHIHVPKDQEVDKEVSQVDDLGRAEDLDEGAGGAGTGGTDEPTYDDPTIVGEEDFSKMDYNPEILQFERKTNRLLSLSSSFLGERDGIKSLDRYEKSVEERVHVDNSTRLSVAYRNAELYANIQGREY